MAVLYVFLFKSATSGDNKTWNTSPSANANQVRLVSTSLFSGMRNLFLLLLFHVFTSGGHYKQLNTILTKILTLTRFFSWELMLRPVAQLYGQGLFSLLQIVILHSS